MHQPNPLTTNRKSHGLTPYHGLIEVALLGTEHVHASDYADGLANVPQVSMSHVWDRDLQSATAFGSWRNLRVKSGYQHILMDPAINAVVIASATSDHGELIRAALSVGKHVFVEKALSSDPREARELVNMARASGVVMMVALDCLNLGLIQTARQIIEQNRIGIVTRACISLSHDGASKGWLPDSFFDLERSRGGVLIDLGAHPLYLLISLFGEPRHVAAIVTHVTQRQAEDNMVTVLGFDGGAIGVAEASFTMARSSLRIELHGTEGTFTGENNRPAAQIRRGRTDWSGLSEPEEVTLPARGPRAYEDFIHHIRQGVFPHDNLELAVTLAEVTQRAYQSAACNC